MEKKKILITGGSGLIGRELSETLIAEGHEVSWLSRKGDPSAPIPRYFWDPKAERIDETALDGVQVIIHLAGAGIVDKPWTDSRKKELIESRTLGTYFLAKRLHDLDHSVEHYISASGIGYYGAQTSERIYAETDGPYPDFVSQICQEWEEAVEDIADLGIKAAILRTGVVLSSKGGALPQLARPIKFGIGSPIGSGKQWMPWIHMEDLVQMYLHVLRNELADVYNAINNDHQTNAAFSRHVAQQLNRPFFMPNVPAFVMKAILGSRAPLVLNGSRVSADKIMESGFEFKYPLLHQALENLYS